MLVFLLTLFVLCKLCSEADTLYEQDNRIRLALSSRRTTILNVRFMPRFSLESCRSSIYRTIIVILIRSVIHPDVDDCVMGSQRTKADVKVVAQGSVIDVTQNVVYYRKLALTQ